ncbi:4-(cytidine 5'-diphospho)-2-C-methyl-D-erythritol kinase [Parvularcula oceani]|uniref:4-(cytidine 5'-diphospho)-2-C-methyl-D-erythritol kinase n=1 Tax=Parvularcula oceani TaxID=1247963 RepID=UPI00068E99B2|nr:4-(cytidine 5'-diphospho)-2-C-methyl-D-erythritol kinase [Parvularcula oceani]
MKTSEGAALQALVKVNLTLHVGRARADGYHPVDTICLFPEIGDRVALGPRSDAFTLEVTGPAAKDLEGLPPRDNLVLKAADLLAAATTIAPRRLLLEKRVPAASGIGGGTADAAAALILLNRSAEAPLPAQALVALSARLGADGPVCTRALLDGGGAFRARGAGEKISSLPPPPPLWMVLSNPGIAVPTGRVFRRFDGTCPPAAPSPNRRTGRTTSALLSAAQAGRNDLQPPAEAIAPQIRLVERSLRAAPGALLARMSGSGATVFALFASAAAAARCLRRERSAGRWAEAGPLARGAGIPC